MAVYMFCLMFDVLGSMFDVQKLLVASREDIFPRPQLIVGRQEDVVAVKYIRTSNIRKQLTVDNSQLSCRACEWCDR